MMNANLALAIIITFLFQSILLSNPIHPETNKDTSALTTHFIDNDTITIAIQRINERIDKAIEKQTTDRVYMLVISISAAFAACVSAWVACMLLRNAKIQKRVTLFNTRFQIYDIIRKTMVGAEATNGDSLVRAGLFPTYLLFLKGTMDKELFFKERVCDEVNRIQDVLTKMNSNAASLDMAMKLQHQADIDALREEQKMHSEVLKKWIEGESSKLMILFKEYLNFRDP